ncbi:MAG: cation diffusion facilitator family transporter [Propionibacteriaceae bacterium]|nr:cation diffusion facilitator family transporter [Propionibacteriaceae bacterium]
MSKPRNPLIRYIWLSIATAIATLLIKMAAAAMTNSVGLWSDALESTVNLIAAVFALWALKVSVRPPDHDHDFGHGKAEYLSAAGEGMMILIAAASIIYNAVLRFLHPGTLDNLSWGLVLSLSASLLNLATGWYLIRVGKRTRSATLQADGRHLLTDVVTSAGVLVAILLVMFTGWTILDPIIAVLVGLNITWTGAHIVRQSFVGLLDAALPPNDVAKVKAALEETANKAGAEMTDLRTRESGRQRFLYVILEVPGTWTVRHSHDVADQIEDAAAKVLAGAETFVHIEPK